jgi:hypothetical protein
MPRKSNLISLSLNCGSQQQNNVFIIKDERVTAQLSFGGKTDPATGPGCLSPSHNGHARSLGLERTPGEARARGGYAHATEP